MRITDAALIAVLLAHNVASNAGAATLRSLGAKGDGRSDDRAAIEAALSKSAGTPLDGEGLTYVVNGTISVRNSVELRNATFKQVMAPVDTSKFIQSWKTTTQPATIKPADGVRTVIDGQPMFTAAAEAVYNEDPVLSAGDFEAVEKSNNLRTLSVINNGNTSISVTLEKVKVDRGSHADSGLHSRAAGLYIVGADPVKLTGVEVTGHGRGSGLYMRNCSNVRMDGVNIHDIHWAPFQGDKEWTAAQLAKFGWNHNPIYDFNPALKKFVRVRIQEQLTGMSLFGCTNVEIVNTHVDRIGTMVEGTFYPWQADGITVDAAKNFTIQDSEISEVWEGIDMTGRGVDGFIEQNVLIKDTFSYCFKYAHPIKNGKITSCTAERAGYHGYTIGSECSNMTFTNCVARETGAKKYWWRNGKPGGISGFSVAALPNELPRNIVLKDCAAINQELPGSMGHGFSIPLIGAAPELGNYLVNPKVAGAAEEPILNFPQK